MRAGYGLRTTPAHGATSAGGPSGLGSGRHREPESHPGSINR